MIKFVHLADVHLGMENYGTVDRRTGLNSRFLDFLKSLDSVVDYTLHQSIDFFLFAGDAFKTRDPSPTQQREFAKRIKKIAAAGIPVVLVIGNHDLPNAAGKADTLEIYKTLSVANVYISQRPELLKFKKTARRWVLDNQVSSKKDGTVLQIATLPWITRSSLISQENYRRKTITEVDNLATRGIVKIVRDLAERVERRWPVVLVAHATVAGAVFGAERKVYVGHDIVLPLNIFQQPWQYVALGHLHRYQILTKNPPVVYAGSIERVDFGEATETKGFSVVTIKQRRGIFHARHRFIPTPARKFVTIRVLIEDDNQHPTEKVCAVIKKHRVKDCVVKLVITIPETVVGFLAEDRIRASLATAAYLAGIKKEIIKTARLVTGVKDIESIDPLTALEEYFLRRRKKNRPVKDLRVLARKLVKEIAED